jgi:hypothetical protein
MIGNWTGWKRFPNAQRGEHVEAPIGPGLYEVRQVSSGDLAAFAASPIVAYALSALRRAPSPRSWMSLFKNKETSSSGELEYRTCAAATLSEAKMMAQCLLDRRQAYWRRSAMPIRAGSPAGSH